MKKLLTLIEVEIDLPEEQNTEDVLNNYKAGVYEMMKGETDDNAKITVTLKVLD